MTSEQRFRIRMNIINLLRIRNISQSTLKNDLGIDKSTLSRYLNGREDISHNNLIKIAQYFDVTPESLMNEDYSKIKGNNMDGNILCKSIKKLLPIFSDEHAINNPVFMAAYNEQCALYDRIENLDFSLEGIDIDTITDNYEKIIHDGNDKEPAVANYLSLLFFTLLDMQGRSLLADDYQSLPINIKQSLALTLNKHLSLQQAISDTDNNYNEIIESQEFFDLITDYYTILKQQYKWVSIAEYYFCLQFFWSFVPNPFSRQQNKTFGRDMLYLAAASGNTYADQFILMMFIT